MNSFSIVSLNISARRGVPKEPVPMMRLDPEKGIIGDAHGGKWRRQVSLLAREATETVSGPGVKPGSFAENITTSGVDPSRLPVGTRVQIGDAELEITQIGKSCHEGCAIQREKGRCVMPTQGVFARVVRGGEITVGDTCYYRL